MPQADRLVISFLWDIDQPSFERREICVYVTGQHVPWFVKMKLNNTYFGIWLPFAAGAQPFQVIILRTFFASISEELFEAGRIDGASEWRMLTSIAVPLAKPIVITLILLQALGTWNEYVWPMMVLSKPDRYSAMLAVLNFGQLMTGRYDPGAEYAGYVISGLPLLVMFVFGSRAFIRGLTSGAVKM